MKIILTVVTFLSFYLVSAQTDNMDFEEGTFNHWNLAVGGRTSSNAENYSGSQADLNDHLQIMNPASPPFDEDALLCTPALNIPTSYPGGVFSAKIGNLLGGRRAAKMSRTFTVTAAESYLLYSYAIVLQDPGHSQASQPKFVVNIKDANGNIVTCGKFEAFAGPNAANQGFVACGQFGNLQILPWTSGGADLSPFIGQQITIEFIALDCMLGGHGGTAYVDATVESLEIQVDGLCSAGPEDITLSAPLGFTSYSWTAGSDTTVIGTDQTLDVVGAQYGDEFTVALTSNTGCDTVATITLGPVGTVTIDPIPDQEICEGGFAIILPTGNNVGSYSFPDLGTIGNSAVVSPTTDTTYTVTALDENGCAGPSTTVNITVIPSTGPPFPSADFEMEAIVTDPDNPCNTIQFTNLSDYCRSDLTYLWDFGDGSPTSTEQNPIHTFPVNGPFQLYYITLTVTSAGDGLTDAQTSTFRTSTINPSFYLREDCGVVTIFNISSICGATFDLFPSFTYSWDFGDGNPPVITDSTQPEFNYTYTTSGTYTVVLTMSNSSGSIQLTAERNVNVTASPSVDFEYYLDCYDVQFINQADFCDPITSYHWDFGDSNVSTSASPMHTYTTVGPFNVTLTVSDGTTTIQHTESVLLNPTVVIPEFTTAQICNEVSFTDLSNSCVPLTYEWNFGDGSTISTDENPVHTFAYDGVVSNDAIYNVTLTINDGTQDYQITKPVTITSAFLYNAPQNLQACGDTANPESSSFNLALQSDVILGNVNPSTPFYPHVTYHINQSDADGSLNPLVFDYTNTSNPQTIIARVEDNDGCYQTFSFSLEVFIAPSINAIAAINFCMPKQQSSIYNLTQIDGLVFEGLNQTNVNLSYHILESEAISNQNSITSINLQAGVDYVVYIRAENTENIACFTIGSFNIRMDNEDTDVNNRCMPFFANTMTPNGDGSNDTFYIDNIDTFPNNHLTIYNRWGEKVYETKGYINNWNGTYNGKPLPVATYYYVMELNDFEKRKHAGYISILR